MGSLRCANSEALARYERENDERERVYEENCESMFRELDEVVLMISEIKKRYELHDEADEYIKDNL